MVDQLIAPLNTESLGQLAQSVVQVTDLFYYWKKRSSQIQIPAYKKEVFDLTDDLDKTCRAYEKTLKQAAKESETGAAVARDVVDLMEQLFRPNRLHEDVQCFQEDLSRRINDSEAAARELKLEFDSVRGSLLGARQRVPELTDGIHDYGGATVPTEAKILAAAARVTAIVFTPLAGKAKELRATADPSKRLSAAQAALGVLGGIEPALDRAIEVVGKLVDFWSQLSVAIRSTTPDHLLGMNNTTLRKCMTHWNEIEQKYKAYASTAQLSKQKLEVMREDVAISRSNSDASNSSRSKRRNR